MRLMTVGVALAVAICAVGCEQLQEALGIGDEEEFYWVECDEHDPDCVSLGGDDDPEESTTNDPYEYDEEQLMADDPRARMRAKLRQLGQDGKIAEGASSEEIEAIIDERVEKGVLPKAQAEKLKKTLAGSAKRKARLDAMDRNLFE